MVTSLRRHKVEHSLVVFIDLPIVSDIVVLRRLGVDGLDIFESLGYLLYLAGRQGFNQIIYLLHVI